MGPKPLPLTAADFTPSDVARFLDKVEPSKGSSCLLWTGGHNSRGYPTFHSGQGRKNRRTLFAHRVAYALFRGPVPAKEGDHVCETKSCVNPYHLEFVSSRENLKRRNGGRFNYHTTEEMPPEL